MMAKMTINETRNLMNTTKSMFVEVTPFRGKLTYEQRLNLLSKLRMQANEMVGKFQKNAEKYNALADFDSLSDEAISQGNLNEHYSFKKVMQELYGFLEMISVLDDELSNM
jgi:hypothetical protein